MDYQILIAETIYALAGEVNEFCRKGWVPCGGVAVSNESGPRGPSIEYLQAMTSTEQSRIAAARASDY